MMKNRWRSKVSPPPETEHAFSLVELSIVLVILGLLVGGVLSGQSLIRASELRSVIREYDSYVTATQSFRDKYFALPGDMTSATSFWPSTVNGNGDGSLYIGNPGESYRYWQHLANAGLVAGTYTGVTGAGGTFDSDIGANVPASKLSTAGWTIYTFANIGTASDGNVVGAGNEFDGNYRNIYTFGADFPGNVTITPVLRPEEAWNIDTKIDNGLPGRGKVRTWKSTSLVMQGCATTAFETTAEYALNDRGIKCALVFSTGY